MLLNTFVYSITNHRALNVNVGNSLKQQGFFDRFQEGSSMSPRGAERGEVLVGGWESGGVNTPLSRPDGL